jgi:hypothetical protein
MPLKITAPAVKKNSLNKQPGVRKKKLVDK